MKKILIVDDDRKQRSVLAEVIKTKCLVLEAGQPEDALRVFKDEKPDGISLDYDLGSSIHGDELLRLMKAERPEAQIIVVTGSGHLKEQMLLHGADGFMEKPVQLRDFLDFFIRRGLA